MKNVIFSLLFLTIVLIAECQVSEPYIVRSSASPCLNVREDHNTDAASVACIVPGTPVTVVASVPFWREIIFGNNERGWVAKKFIEPAQQSEINTDVTIPVDALLTIHFIDVGQGDAIWIQTHDDGIDGNGIFEGHSIIIDGGPYSADSANPLLTYIENQGYHGAVVEALFVTHPHNDHFNGAETISRHFTIKNYYDPGYPNNLSSYSSFLNAMRGSDGNPGRAENTHLGIQTFGNLDWGRELQVEVLYAWRGDPDNTLGSGSTETNNASIVLRIQYGTHSFLFMGDAEGKDRNENPDTPRYVEKILLASSPEKLKSTVLKIAHHGSETSSTLPFIQAVDPEVVIVQSGRKSFGGTYLPDVSTLQRYCDFNPNVRIYRTDESDEADGLTGRSAVDNDNIVIKTNGAGQLQIQALRNGQAFVGTFCHN